MEKDRADKIAEDKYVLADRSREQEALKGQLKKGSIFCMRREKS